MEGLSYQEITRMVGRNVSTTSREIRRNCTHMYDIPTYYPHTAQKKYLLRRSYCHRGIFHSQEVIEYINGRLKAIWSPEQITCTPCELKMPSWWQAARARAKPASPPWRSARHAFTLSLRFLTEGLRPWRTRSSLCGPASLPSWSRPLLVTGARNLPTDAGLKNDCTVISILPPPTVLGRKARTRISTACSGSSIQKAGIYSGSLLPP